MEQSLWPFEVPAYSASPSPAHISISMYKVKFEHVVAFGRYHTIHPPSFGAPVEAVS